MRAFVRVISLLFGSVVSAESIEIKGINWFMSVRQIINVIEGECGLSCLRARAVQRSAKAFVCRDKERENSY